MNILSFDIEDWWVYEKYSIGQKKDYLHRLDNYLIKILDLLDESDTKATFFILGAVAASFPSVVKEIASRNHHIGCHSFNHIFLGDASYKEVAEDTFKAIDTIESLIGQKVLAYRAPALSIMKSNNWVFEILAINGIKYDSSILPADRSFGGYLGFPYSEPCIIQGTQFSIKEFPLPTTNVLGKRLAYTGGGYFRLFPYSITKKLMKQSNYVNTYFHIKDFDKHQKRKFASLEGENAIIRYFKDYYGLNGNYSKFKQLLNDFEFVSVAEAVRIINWNQAPIVNI